MANGVVAGPARAHAAPASGERMTDNLRLCVPSSVRRGEECISLTRWTCFATRSRGHFKKRAARARRPRSAKCLPCISPGASDELKTTIIYAHLLTGADAESAARPTGLATGPMSARQGRPITRREP